MSKGTDTETITDNREVNTSLTAVFILLALCEMASLSVLCHLLNELIWNSGLHFEFSLYVQIPKSAEDNIFIFGDA